MIVFSYYEATASRRSQENRSTVAGYSSSRRSLRAMVPMLVTALFVASTDPASGSPGGTLTLYDSRTAFQAANPGLDMEDFSDTNVPPGDIASCSAPFDTNTDNLCFSPNDILPGISMDVTVNGGVYEGVVLTPPFDGVTCVSVGANDFSDHVDWILDPPAQAVGFDFQSYFPGQQFQVTYFSPSQELGSTTVDGIGVGGLVFLGADTTDPAGIHRVEIRPPSGQEDTHGELFCNLEFGSPPASVELAFDPPDLDFGTIDVGSTSPPRFATLHNLGNLEAVGLVFGPLPETFTLDTGSCGDTLPPGGSCDISVTFTPLGPGPASGNLQVTAFGGASASLLLTGRGAGESALVPTALSVDLDPFLTDGNGIFEPGELVEVAPTWRNDGAGIEPLTGTASNFHGIDGAVYFLAQGNADYGNVEPGATSGCRDTGMCYWMAVNDPATRPATHWEAGFDESVAGETMHAWRLHIGDSFTDVPRSSPFYEAIETMLHLEVTGGCTDIEYCPAGTNTRGQMAVFLLKAAEGGDYVPPACVESEQRFADVPFNSPLCPWIEELADRQVTSGCGGDNYCPGAPVTRAQMAIFLLKAFESEGYTPPECMGTFADVTCPSPFAAWVEELAARGVTSGCAETEYCPAAPVTRAQMAVFVTKTFGLTLYGP